MSLPVGRLRRGRLRCASFAALGLLVSALLGPALAGAPETPAPAQPPGATLPPSSPLPSAETPQAPTPGAAETPQAPAGGGAETPAAPSAPSFEMPIQATVPIVYLGKQDDEPLPLSYAEQPITYKGIQGARLMLKEANQAGRLVAYDFDLVEAMVSTEGRLVAKAKKALAKGDAFIIADVEPAYLIAVADLPEAKNSVLMNIRSSATSLRQEQCRGNVFHVIPDYAMRADALAQYLIWKKWPRWFVIRRDTPQDQDYLAMVKRSAARFGGKVVDDKVYDLPPGARNLDSGHQQIQAQIPMETEQAPDHDVVWVINSDDDFGDYLAYRTHIPRPIVGTQGLQAVAWDKSYTESGAMHFQNAIPRIAKRQPVERDYAAWLAFRSLSDSAMKSGKTTPQDLKAYLLSDQFKIEGFKGQALSFRTWDHQMRQPIILGGGTRVPVSTSPQEGFLHEKFLTDTLGFDEPETKCKF